tara:strand:- start:545 stop:700 length:156 start_codon:yes stop_codon:yes gene_type:complete
MKNIFSSKTIKWSLSERVNIFFQDLIELPNDIFEDGLTNAFTDMFTQKYLK